ncbi:MAG: hypothetical protein OHK0053_20540 [Microscillaceae bacterium]
MKHLSFSICLFVFFLGFFAPVQAQLFQPLTENELGQQNGLAVAYRILNQREQEVKNKGTYDRFEVRLEVSNNGSFNLSRLLSEYRQDNTRINPPVVVEVICRNATGYRLTSTNSTFKMDTRYLDYKTKINPQGKDDDEANWRTTRIPIGYFWEVGQRKTDDLIFIVPKGEKPQLEFRVMNQL